MHTSNVLLCQMYRLRYAHTNVYKCRVWLNKKLLIHEHHIWRRDLITADGIAQLPTTAALAPAFLGNAPAPFPQTPDSDKDDWNVWLSAWNNYLSVFTTLSPGQLTDAVKNAMLLNALGAEGFRKSTADPIFFVLKNG